MEFFRKAKNVIGGFVQGNYWFGRTFTERFSDSRMAGIFDALAGGALTAYTGVSAVGTALGAVSAIAGAATAPVHALVTVPLAAVFLTLEACMAGMGIGLLGAAYSKSGLPYPSSFVDSTKESFNAGVSKTANFSKKISNFGKKFSFGFNKSAGKPSAPKKKGPSSGNHFDL